MKYLTIVTNFEGPDIGVPLTKLSSLDMLKAAVQFEKAKAVRVTGGSDPLFEYEKHQKYFQRLFRACREIDIPVELETACIESEFPYKKCSRVIYHLNDFDKLATIVRHGQEIVRVVFVVDKSCTLDLIDKVTVFCDASDIIDELHFRVKYEDKGSGLAKCCREYLSKEHDGSWRFVEKFEESPPYFVNGEIRYHWSDIFG